MKINFYSFYFVIESSQTLFVFIYIKKIRAKTPYGNKKKNHSKWLSYTYGATSVINPATCTHWYSLSLFARVDFVEHAIKFSRQSGNFNYSSNSFLFRHCLPLTFLSDDHITIPIDSGEEAITDIIWGDMKIGREEWKSCCCPVGRRDKKRRRWFTLATRAIVVCCVVWKEKRQKGRQTSL